MYIYTCIFPRLLFLLNNNERERDLYYYTPNVLIFDISNAQEI